MSFTKKMFSRKFFFINLVLVGIIVGFVAALAIFAGGATKTTNDATALAETAPKNKISSSDGVLTAKAIQSAFNYVAETVLPSVVELDVVGVSTQPSIGNSPWRFFFGDPNQLQEENPMPQEKEEHGLGSGIIVRKNGNKAYILTNNHVVANSKKITIKLYDEREFEGKLLGVDSRRDLAVVEFDCQNENIKVANLGDSDAIKVGDWAIAIGSPYGLVSSVTAGIVSAIGRDGGPEGNISDFIQTDAAINKGNSGGALANIDGEVIGINTWIASTTGGSIGLGFSIPINNAVRVIDDIISGGQVKNGWLGVLMTDAEKDYLSNLGFDDTKGALIGHVFTDGPASKGGLLPGDYVTAIDGKAILSVNQLIRIVGDCKVGSKTVFTVIRNGLSKDLTVTIDERKEEATTDYSKLWPGLEVQVITDSIIKSLKLPKNTNGLIVSSVIAKSPASTLGLKNGDIILEINDKKISTLKEYYAALNDSSAKKWQFMVKRDGQTLTTLALIRK